MLPGHTPVALSARLAVIQLARTDPGHAITIYMPRAVAMLYVKCIVRQYLQLPSRLSSRVFHALIKRECHVSTLTTKCLLSKYCRNCFSPKIKVAISLRVAQYALSAAEKQRLAYSRTRYFQSCSCFKIAKAEVGDALVSKR